MRKLSTKEIIERFKKIHGDKFDYSLVDYNNLDTKVKIICPVHGEFEQTPRNHIKGNDCFECSIRRRSKSNEKFIKQAKQVHNNFYDYSLTKYKNYRTKVKIVCPIHGEFVQYPNEHISKKSGCKKCGMERTRISTVHNKDKFVEKAIKVHGNKFNYNKVVYVNSYTRVIIICPKHGDFSQKPGDHIHSSAGCPICKESKGERLVSNILESLNLKYIPQKTFNNLRYKYLLHFDFYIPSLNVCIEFDGEQHFRPVMGWGGDELFKNVQHRDNLKNEYCKNNNIPLLRISYIDYDNGKVHDKILEFLGVNERMTVSFRNCNL